MKTDYTTHIIYFNYILLSDRQMDKGVIEETEKSYSTRATIGGKVTMLQLMEALETLLDTGSIQSYYILDTLDPIKIIPLTDYETTTTNG
jgi:hypothetical protein